MYIKKRPFYDKLCMLPSKFFFCLVQLYSTSILLHSASTIHKHRNSILFGGQTHSYDVQIEVTNEYNVKEENTTKTIN